MYHIGNYGVKHYIADTYSDISKIPVNDAMPGSTVFVIDASTYYMLNGEKRWVSIDLGSTGGGSVPGHIIYEGGGV